MSGQLIPRAPKRKKQPTAEQLREQLALAAEEIIRLRSIGSWPGVTVWGPDGEQIETTCIGSGEPPPPPKPPSCRIEYSHLFGRLMFDSVEEFEQWCLQPWWRRFLGLRPPKPRMTDYEWRRWLDSKAPKHGGYQPISNGEPPRDPPKAP